MYDYQNTTKSFCQKYSVLALAMYSLCLFSIADFPAGNVRVTVYSNGVPLSKTQMQYYSNMEEITCLLARAADPVDFMCQVKPLKGSFTSLLSLIQLYLSECYGKTGNFTVFTHKG